MPRTMQITNVENYRPWLIRIVFVGDRYGRDDCLKLDHGEKVLVEYYDQTHVADWDTFEDRGQFVSRYNADTLLNLPGGYGSGDTGKTGICLMGYEPEAWSICAETQQVILDWLRLELKDYINRKNSEA